MLYKVLVRLADFLLKIFCFYRVKGRENIPKDGAFILCSNHRSSMDPVLIATGCPRQLTFMAKEELFRNKLSGKFIKMLGAFPIKRGRGDAGAVMAVLKIMRRGEVTLIFPEGTRMKNGERKEVNPGIIRLALQANVPIIPVYTGKRSVTYGKPIVYTDYSDDATNTDVMQKLANDLMNNIYGMEG